MNASPPNFTASYTYKWTFSKKDILECTENQAIWGGVIEFGSYGSWILSFYPNGYNSSIPAKFAIILKTSSQNNKNIPSCLAKAELTLSNASNPQESKTIKFANRYHSISKISPVIGCGWYKKDLLTNFPEIKTWDKFCITMVCHFTAIEHNAIDDMNWITYDFLSRYISYASDYFFKLDLNGQKLENQNVDINVVYTVKSALSRETKEMSLPMHKSMLIKQSPYFVKHFEKNPNDFTVSFPNYSANVIKDIVLFCYKNSLDLYTEEHLAFATQYEMKELLLKADEYLSNAAKKSNVKKMMALTEKYYLPELTKKCFYISENGSKAGFYKAFFISFMQSIVSFFQNFFRKKYHNV